MQPLVIQHIGVYTTCPTSSPPSHSEPPPESHTQEIIKLSSFLSATSASPLNRSTLPSLDTRACVHTMLSHSNSHSRLRLSKFTKTTSTSAGTASPLTATAMTNTTEEPQREKSASSPAAIAAGEEGFIGKETPLRVLCWQFLTSMYGNHQTAEFWRRCSTCLFASLVQLSLGDLSLDRRRQDFLKHMQSIFEEAMRDSSSQQSESRSDESDHQASSFTTQPPTDSQIVSTSSFQIPAVCPSLSATSGFTSTSPNPPFTSRPEDSILFNICALATNLNEIRRSTTSQLDEILKRLSNLEEASSKPIMRDKEKGKKTKKPSHKKQDISPPVSTNSEKLVNKETEVKSSRKEITSESSKSTKKDTNKSTDHKNDKDCDHDHVDDGGVRSKEEGEKLINQMADALRKAREDGLSQSLNKKPPLSAASNYLMTHNIRKRILHVGNPSKMPAECTAPGGGIAYPKHTKFIFDYRIGDPDTPEDFLDDTKKYGKKMELYSGKDFQIEFWEYCLQTMMVGEVSSFMVPPSQLSAFPMVNKKLRDYMLNRTPDSANPSKHACAFMSLQAQGGLGYPDLDEFLLKPKMLEFVFDLHSVILPNEAPKESWIMTPEEKVEAIPRLRKEGNDLYAQGQWFNSAAKYEEALNLIEQLILVEKPGEPEYEQLDQSRVPFYLNMAQCQFKLKDYYGAIRSASEALTRDKDNVKALFRRAQAYSATSDVQLAEADYLRVRELAPDTMTACVNRELANLERISRECEEQKRRLLAGKFFKMQSS
ncbi:unnamed protein product [Hymenolepis diminuta]|uniref:AIP/AIPL N-terminal FKBP-type PPIase domain-containing protein n=1 Tax=Hymenolepis diminuta TaxID=6216 RepID=A0A3P7BPB6_HYMDI|nr:unnamed protein product [Hymenolepis diminuta]